MERLFSGSIVVEDGDDKGKFQKVLKHSKSPTSRLRQSPIHHVQNAGCFYKRKTDDHDTTEITNQNSKRSKASTSEPKPENLNQPLPEEHIPKTGGPNGEEVDPNSLERDPAKRKQLSLYPVNQQGTS
ncbi:hypothetical protein L1887_41908 [Cichorium endivia]|nr:hypothetical protein L1887_41908 [Cichorium endivia]